MKNACLSAIAVALAATSAFAYPQYAPTCEEDIRAAILFREENMNKSARWESALKSWFGAGEECLHCADDPCGNHGYHGNWEGLECRGDWITDDGWSRWSGQKSGKGNCSKAAQPKRCGVLWWQWRRRPQAPGCHRRPR